MYFILSKTLYFLLMPFLWVLLLLLLALFLKSPRHRRLCLLSAVVVLLALSNPFLANEAWRAWEVEATPISALRKYDAAVILGGITTYRADIPDRVHTSKGADRVLHPLQLYRMGKVGSFIITGGQSQILGKRVPEAEQMEKILLMAGVPEKKIITENNSRNTRENALHTAALLAQHPDLRNILLVTSAFHMRRSVGCFRKAGIAVTPFSADFNSKERSFTPDETLIPSISAFNDWHLLLHEVSGYVIYKFLGYC